jgi:hypothetical protein
VDEVEYNDAMEAIRAAVDGADLTTEDWDFIGSWDFSDGTSPLRREPADRRRPRVHSSQIALS